MKLKLFYAAGPGDVAGTYRYWKDNLDDPAVLSYTDSGLFYDLVRELDAEALVVSRCQRPDTIKDGSYTIINHPKQYGKGLLFHFHHLFYGLQMCFMALRYRANIAVIEEGTSYWFVWNLLSLFGIRVIASLKCTLWLQFKPIDRKQKWINFFDRTFFKEHASAILSISKTITDQVKTLTQGNHAPIIEFIQLYKPETFASIPEPIHSKESFHIIYMGRIERNKGVFDLVEIAARFKKQGLNQIHFHFCGSGSSAEELQNKILLEQVETSCHFHGFCKRPKLLEALGLSHVLIAPTHTSFLEGYPLVVAEGVLAGRPVITSKVCPAIYAVAEAVVEAQPDDLDSYQKAILDLYDDEKLYNLKKQACRHARLQFFDPQKSWKAALHSVIKTQNSEAGMSFLHK